MGRSSPLVFLAACAAGLALVAGIASTGSAAHPGLYTKAQAAAGAKTYTARCLRCHGAKLQGVTAPALKGKDSPITGIRTVGDIYNYASTQMPLDKPGSLSPATYASLVAFLLQQNGHPAGPRALTPDAAKRSTEKM
ncbi:MAG: cytochrome c class [Candidatus Eremiobacteraeota bacterium]|nr:cytochrome c class [Candidatus Eremiobacteraeota bacterium]